MGPGVATVFATGSTGPGTDGARAIVGLIASFVPQCWQNAKPAGVWPPHDGQICGPAVGTVGATAGPERPAPDGGRGTPFDGGVGMRTGALGGEDALTTGAGATPDPLSGEPHILQKFIPGGFAAPHEPQASRAAPGNPAASVGGRTLVSGSPPAPSAASLLPQSWQKSAPSRFVRPHLEQRAIVVDNAPDALLRIRLRSSIVTRPERSSTPVSWRLLLWMVGLGLGLGCGAPMVREAPFSLRPDSVDRGDLRGPFDGRVLDAENGRPVAQALVVASWTFVSGFGLDAPSSAKEAIASTDANGRYVIGRLDDLPHGSARLSDFHLVIYKRGYVAYRSDRRFEDLGPRTDFAQTGYVVNLDRWRNDYSHVRHLRYVGGGPVLGELTAWEIPEAAAELSGEKTGAPIAMPSSQPSAEILHAEHLLKPDDVNRATGYTGGFDSSELGDEPTSSHYGSVHLQARGKDETYDVALRVWRFAPADASSHFDRLTHELPGAQVKNEIGDKSLRASTPKGDILGVAFLDAKRGVVALIQCGSSQCRSHDDVLNLARVVQTRVQTEYKEQQP
jgi:hypothetical protein